MNAQTETFEDFAERIGADGAVSNQSISIYIPNKDCVGMEIGNQRAWVMEALTLLGEINGGATAMPPVEGTWLNDDGDLISENPIVVYSYVADEKHFLNSLDAIREFAHRLGRETNQGEIVVEFDGMFYRITEFDPE